MLRSATVALATSAVLVAVAAAPAGAASPSLASQLGSALAGSGSTGMSVRVDVAGRGTVFTRTPALALSPASTEKLITAYTALRVLGPSHRFVTRVGSTVAPDPHGVIRGRLVVTAGGDPTLTSAGLRTLARQLHAKGVRTITGGIVLDDTLFGRQRRAAGWKPQWVPEELGPLSAFSVDGNGWRTDAGYLGNPSIGNLQAVGRALAAAGIAVHGHFTVGHPSSKPHPLTSVSSAPLSSVVRTMLKVSDNFYAEILLEDVGAARGLGSSLGGVKVIRAEAAKMHLRLGGNIEDGSGLSRLDRMSANAEVAWLVATTRDPRLGPYLYAGLPIGCVDGTLKARLCGTVHRVHAKTGTLDGMRALSGFVVNAAGHRVTFSFLIGGPLSSAYRARTAIDKAVTVLSRSHL